MNLRDDMTGAVLLADWLGEGCRPVEPLEAALRSRPCLSGNHGEPCPLNIEPNWWGRVKHEIADWIKGELELKHNMGLRLPEDEQLHMCKLCGCCLQLKVWTPEHTLKKHIPKTKLENAPEYCWLRRLHT